MKKIKLISASVIIMMTLILSSSKVYSQDTKNAEIKIKTSAICDMCKEAIENSLAFEKGIKKSELDVESKVITVTYNPGKITPEEIRKAIAKVGYDADDVPANKKAYNKLDGCCKKGAVCDDKK